MSGIARRTILVGVGLIGVGVLGYGGSLAACAIRDQRLAFVEPLFIALKDIPAPDDLGRAWLDVENADQVLSGLLAKQNLLGIALTPDFTSRMQQLRAAIRQDFSSGDTVLSNGWVSARSEARIAAAWVSAHL